MHQTIDILMDGHYAMSSLCDHGTFMEVQGCCMIADQHIINITNNGDIVLYATVQFREHVFVTHTHKMHIEDQSKDQSFVFTNDNRQYKLVLSKRLTWFPGEDYVAEIMSWDRQNERWWEQRYTRASVAINAYTQLYDNQ